MAENHWNGRKMKENQWKNRINREKLASTKIQKKSQTPGKKKSKNNFAPILLCHHIDFHPVDSFVFSPGIKRGEPDNELCRVGLLQISRRLMRVNPWGAWCEPCIPCPRGPPSPVGELNTQLLKTCWRPHESLAWGKPGIAWLQSIGGKAGIFSPSDALEIVSVWFRHQWEVPAQPDQRQETMRSLQAAYENWTGCWQQILQQLESYDKETQQGNEASFNIPYYIPCIINNYHHCHDSWCIIYIYIYYIVQTAVVIIYWNCPVSKADFCLPCWLLTCSRSCSGNAEKNLKLSMVNTCVPAKQADYRILLMGFTTCSLLAAMSVFRVSQVQPGLFH